MIFAVQVHDEKVQLCGVLPGTTWPVNQLSEALLKIFLVDSASGKNAEKELYILGFGFIDDMIDLLVSGELNYFFFFFFLV